jgi:hypothetical protein
MQSLGYFYPRLHDKPSGIRQTTSLGVRFPEIKEITKRTRNTKNRILNAMKAPPATIPKPNIPAIKAITRNRSDQLSMGKSSAWN